jgi:TPP-dependent pyruvate/acetoin dehydrogenase alpha subunit
VVAVHEIAGEMVAKARAGEGPAFLECKTYRWRGHFEIDMIPDLRPVEEIESWKKKCPVARLERELLKTGILTAEKIKAMDTEIMARIEDAVTYALESPLPAPEDALENIYSV